MVKSFLQFYLFYAVIDIICAYAMAAKLTFCANVQVGRWLEAVEGCEGFDGVVDVGGCGCFAG
jgi:hypothetical protein